MKLWGFFISIILASATAGAYNVDSTKISVSGISAGAYMAGQLHVAHSASFMGAGIIAGGPYYCSHGELPTALNTCMDTFLGLPDMTRILNNTLSFAHHHLIDDLSHIKNSQVFILTGKNDHTVTRKVVDAGVLFYQKLGVSENSLNYVNHLAVGHAFPTDDYGNVCSVPSEAPWISDCNYDTAGALLKHIYRLKNPKVERNLKSFFSFSQSPYTQNNPAAISMADTAAAYVPANCQKNEKCVLHVVFHGCRQTMEEIQDEFYQNAGYAEWAESNSIILLFPQAAIDIFKGNPKGCWDWWGYTGPYFATQEGPQIKAVYKMVQDFSNPKFKLK